MKASIYVRVSDESQVEEGVSLAAQISKGMALLGAQGWELCRIHQEEGVSGTKASRPELDALLVDVRRGAIGAIIVYDLDRAFRNLDLQGKVLADCRQLGVSIWSSLSRSEIKTDTAGDRLSLNIRGAVAEHYADFIGERTREALSYLRG
jgi:DNA invertase Pin-like site-specific DNA recombinase